MTTASSIAALGYVGLEVSDLSAWRRFATAILGLQAVDREDGGIDLRMDTYATRLRLLSGTADDVAYVGWEVRDDLALERLTGLLRGRDITVHEGSAAEAAGGVYRNVRNGTVSILKCLILLVYDVNHIAGFARKGK